MFVVPFPANKSQANVLEQKKLIVYNQSSSIDRTKEKEKRKHPNYKCYQILLSPNEVKSSQPILYTHLTSPWYSDIIDQYQSVIIIKTDLGYDWQGPIFLNIIINVCSF